MDLEFFAWSYSVNTPKVEGISASDRKKSALKAGLITVGFSSIFVLTGNFVGAAIVTSLGCIFALVVYARTSRTVPDDRSPSGSLRDLHPRPIWQVLVALATSTAALTIGGAIQQHGSVTALGNTTLLFDVLAPAIGLTVILPAGTVAIASLWESKRTARARREIFFAWGMILAVLQTLSIFTTAALRSQ